MSLSETRRPLRDVIGLSAALITPFDGAGAVDWERFAVHARRMLAHGMHVVAAFGTTGEGASISYDVRSSLYQRMAEHGVSPSQLVECIYGTSATDAGHHVRRALAQGAAAILLVPPFYFKNVSDDGVFRWYAEVFETAGPGCRDVILYNIPQLTGVPIGAALVGRLRRQFPEVIAGAKDSGGDWNHTVALIAEHGDIAILVGHEGHLAKAVRQGASGAISGVANIAPALVRKLATGEDDPRIHPLLDQLLALPVVPAIKAIHAGLSGDDSWSRVKPPLLSLERVEARSLYAAVSDLIS